MIQGGIHFLFGIESHELLSGFGLRDLNLVLDLFLFLVAEFFKLFVVEFSEHFVEDQHLRLGAEPGLERILRIWIWPEPFFFLLLLLKAGLIFWRLMEISFPARESSILTPSLL
uniref:Uncharacterized protein n=1 Tax=Lepeophtheirus salmonis TaxID=72036 RepID=A0A0K2UDW3_LEPSM